MKKTDYKAVNILEFACKILCNFHKMNCTFNKMIDQQFAKFV